VVGPVARREHRDRDGRALEGLGARHRHGRAEGRRAARARGPGGLGGGPRSPSRDPRRGHRLRRAAPLLPAAGRPAAPEPGPDQGAGRAAGRARCSVDRRLRRGPAEPARIGRDLRLGGAEAPPRGGAGLAPRPRRPAATGTAAARDASTR
jgi:hypothetical protein